MAKGYGPKSGQLEFKSVVMGFLNRTSDASSLGQNISNIVDALWAMLEPFLEAEDHEKWREKCTEFDGSDTETHRTSIEKVRLISLVLYRIGVLPNRDNLKNRKYEMESTDNKVEHGGLRTHLIQDIELQQFIMRHLMWVSRITKAMMPYDVHMDVLWAFLSPYITEEDFYEWKANNEKIQTDPLYHDYLWNIMKIRICMKVLERADFLWQTGVTDEPEEFIDGDKIAIKSG